LLSATTDDFFAIASVPYGLTVTIAPRRQRLETHLGGRAATSMKI
jgi:hypothetical protein